MDVENQKRELKRKLQEYRQLVRELDPSDTESGELMREYVRMLEQDLRNLET